MSNGIHELRTHEIDIVSGGSLVVEVLKALVVDLVKDAATAPACGMLGAWGVSQYTPSCPK